MVSPEPRGFEALPARIAGGRAAGVGRHRGDAMVDSAVGNQLVEVCLLQAYGLKGVQPVGPRVGLG